MAKLTKRFVERVAPADKDQVMWDDALPGFGLRVKPTGVRSYIIQYRNAQDRSRRFTIGRHGTLTVDEARKIARDKLAAVASGEDPAADRKAARDALDMAALCERYLKEHVAVRNRPCTQRVNRSIVSLYIKPASGRGRLRRLTSRTWTSCTGPWPPPRARRTIPWRCCRKCSTWRSAGRYGRWAPTPAS